MRNVIILAAVLLVASCKRESQEPFGKTEATTETTTEITSTPENLGKELFEGKGACIACHRVETKLVGPSVQDMAKAYKEKNGDLVAFLKEEAQPIMDPSQYEIMKANFAITKAMSNDELKEIEAYIYSTLK